MHRPPARLLHHVALGAALGALAAGCGAKPAPSLSITVGGVRESVPPGTTVAGAAARFQLQPRAGDLLDVGGHVLRRAAFPGRLLLNGHPAAPKASLADGDRISTAPGRSHRESLSTTLVPIRGGVLGNPEFTLARTPGVEVVVRGAVSHELVSARFRPSGSPPTAGREVALTFDDGPSPENTVRILNVLRRFHVHATFFVIGYLASSYPQLVALEHRRGMTVGNHSYNHPEVPPFGQLPGRLMNDEIALAADDIRRAGVEPHLFRPPGGSYSPELVQTARALGERIVLWSVDPGDWVAGATAGGIAARVLAAVRPSSIVILHDGGGDRSATARALPAIIRGIRKRHLRLVALADAPPTLAGG